MSQAEPEVEYVCNGQPGEPGTDGQDGQDGQDGSDGDNGDNGMDGMDADSETPGIQATRANRALLLAPRRCSVPKRFHKGRR